MNVQEKKKMERIYLITILLSIAYFKYTRSSSAINPRRARTTPWFLKKKACASAQFPILNKKDLSYVHNSLFLPKKANCA